MLSVMLDAKPRLLLLRLLLQALLLH